MEFVKLLERKSTKILHFNLRENSTKKKVKRRWGNEKADQQRVIENGSRLSTC